MAVLNFDRILLMLDGPGSIPQETLHSQDGLNLGDIHFCPIRRTLHMQRISLDHLWKLIAEGTFMPPNQRAFQSSVGLLPSSSSSRQTASMRRSQMSFASLSATLGVPCPFPQTRCPASSTQPAM